MVQVPGWDMAYEKLIDFRNRHLKRIRICGRSQRWWDGELAVQVRKVHRERSRVSKVGHRNVLLSENSLMKRSVREKQDKCWKAFGGDSGLHSPCEVVRLAEDSWREWERMGRCKRVYVGWLERDEEKVRGLVSEVFRTLSGGVGCDVGLAQVGEHPMSQEELELSVRRALGGMKNGSALDPEGLVNG